MANEFDWSRFVVRVDIKASPEILFRAWSTQSGMERWFLRMSEYKNGSDVVLGSNETVRTGDRYRWLWHGYPDDTVETGEILESNDRDLFRFSFGKAGNCTVKIYSENDNTIVDLSQENIPTDEAGKQDWHIGCKTGWTFYLANMKSVYEGGIDLRNRNANLQRVLNA